MKTLALSFTILCFFFGNLSAQEKNKEQLKIEKEATNYLAEGGEELAEGDFPNAEVNYRKAIAINPSEEIGKYNLGNAYYNKAKNDEAMMRFKQAASIATNKTEKHKAFHNLGNTFMNAKDYQNAVEAYKNALRNNPTDDETRYNLALAKEMLEKNPPQGGDGEDDNKDQQENEDQKENQDNKDNKDKEGDNEEKEDNKDQGDEKEDEKDGDKEGENEKPQEPKENKEGEQPKQQQPKPGQMSPQQIKNLLDAMNNEEKKVQDKINVQKQKGAKVKSTKDW